MKISFKQETNLALSHSIPSYLVFNLFYFYVIGATGLLLLHLVREKNHSTKNYYNIGPFHDSSNEHKDFITDFTNNIQQIKTVRKKKQEEFKRCTYR